MNCAEKKLNQRRELGRFGAGMYEILDYVQRTFHSEDDLSKGLVEVVHTAL